MVLLEYLKLLLYKVIPLLMNGFRCNKNEKYTENLKTRMFIYLFFLAFFYRFSNAKTKMSVSRI